MKMYQFMLVIVAMALIACGKNGHNESESQQFSLMEIKPRNITLKNTYSASIRGQQDIRIIPRVDGYLTEVLIREGERVRKGQTLFYYRSSLLQKPHYKLQRQMWRSAKRV